MSTPLNASLSRKWRVDVNTGTVATPVWTQVRGVTNLTPGLEVTTQDASDYDTDGWGSDEKTMLKWSLGIALLRKKSDDATYDAGQEALRDKADKFGDDGTAHVRWYDRDGGPEAYSGYANVAWEPGGGGAGDLEPVTVNLTGKGARTEIANPAV